MLDITVSENGRAAAISGAILLYATSQDRLNGANEPVSYATIHSLVHVDGRPEIAPGRLLTQKDLQLIASGVESSSQDSLMQWFDPGVLARSGDRMIWWTPPTMRPMFFKKSGHNDKTFDGNAVCPTPGLIWMAMPGRGLYVYAIKGSDRPTPETPLLQAPFFNVWGRGQVCIGSADLPTEHSKWEASAWEKTFFGSHFTHPNFTQPDRLILGEDPATFWRRMIRRPAKRFPQDRLVQLPLVAGDLLDRLVLDKLNALPQPKGEF